MAEISYNLKGIKKDEALLLYREMLFSRMIEEKMIIQLRQGKASKWFAGIGQEAVSCGVCAAVNEDDYLFPLHRNLGVFTGRGVPLDRLLAQWQGRLAGFTKGRDRSFHFGTKEYKIAGMISHLGANLSFAAGAAMAEKLNGSGAISVAFCGDGGSSEGEFHEALNTAAVWKLPVIFVIENNGYGLSTPTSKQYACEKLVDRAVGYGMKGICIDGNNALEVFSTVRKYANAIRKKPEPIFIECETFRQRGHEEASGTKYVPRELLSHWAERDPVNNFTKFLIDKGLWSSDEEDKLRKQLGKQIIDALEIVETYDFPEPRPEHELGDVYAPYEGKPEEASGERKEMRFVDACADGLRSAMREHDQLVLMGQDIADYGGVFKVTEGFVDEFGEDRVWDTTLCEQAIVGIGLGLALRGFKAMVEMQFSDFVSSGFNQIVNNLAKIHYRWGQAADVVIRMPTGAGVGAGPFHSQSTEGWFTAVPGLKVVYPSNAYDAKGLMLEAFRDPNPILFFEHKFLYRRDKGDVPIDNYCLPIGKGKRINTGDTISIITYGLGVHWAVETVKELELEERVDIVDLRSLQPYDKELILESVKATGKVVVLYEGTYTGGYGAEIASFIAEQAFEWLDGPVVRVASLDTPVPFHQTLEEQFLPKSRLREAVEKLLSY